MLLRDASFGEFERLCETRDSCTKLMAVRSSECFFSKASANRSEL